MERKLISKVLKVGGMTCSSCEMRIERALKKVEGLTEVKAEYNNSSVYVTYDANVVRLAAIIDAIEQLDYKVADKPENKPDGAKQPVRKETGKSAPDGKMKINQLLGIGIIILALYLILKNTGFNFIPSVNQSMGFGLLFVIGMITSLHCVAMCGGINLSQCVSYRYGVKDTGKASKLKPSLMYNAGRVVSYTIIGGIVGALGSAISFSGAAKGFVALLSGVFMVIMGVNMLNIFPWLRKFNPRMPKVFGKKVHENKQNKGPFYVGLLNGLMPCGPLQAMQIYALGTGSFFAGAFSMFMFSVGTVPLMFGLGAASSFLSGKFTHKMMKVSAVLVLTLGFLMVNRGLSLSGISVASALTKDSSGNVATIRGNEQVVTINLQPNSYSPIMVQKGIPVKWHIQADAGSINGCNETIDIPKYNIQKKLVAGDNVIEFTPDAAGNVNYTCWMGMISSTIKVVDDLVGVSKDDLNSLNNSGGSGGSGLTGAGGCCGATPPGFANGKIPTDNIQVAQVKDGKQEVTVTVDNNGYAPAVIVLQKGVQAKIKFDPKQLSGCNSTVVFPEYQGQLDISRKDQQETPWLTPTADFTFQCGMNMLHGYVKVVDDINKINLDDIRKEIGNYKPAGGSGGGGCCG